MSKRFNNIAGTTSSEFEIGTGSVSVRHIVLGAVCTSTSAIAVDRENAQPQVSGIEFIDMKVLAKDNAGNILTKQFRGSVNQDGNINLVEDTFEEGFNGSISVTLSGNNLLITCSKGSATSATFSVYVTLQRIE